MRKTGLALIRERRNAEGAKERDDMKVAGEEGEEGKIISSELWGGSDGRGGAGKTR